MRFRVTLLATVLLAGCGQAPQGAVAPTAQMAAASRQAVPAAVKAALVRFSAAEGRKVTARNVKMNDGRGAAELRVPLSADEEALLVQLYRLHPRKVDATEFPQGLVERSLEHLDMLYRFKFRDRQPLAPARLHDETMTRVYRDGDGTILAYETWLPGDDFQLFGKYDLEGKILKVDIETWEN